MCTCPDSFLGQTYDISHFPVIPTMIRSWASGQWPWAALLMWHELPEPPNFATRMAVRISSIAGRWHWRGVSVANSSSEPSGAQVAWCHCQTIFGAVGTSLMLPDSSSWNRVSINCCHCILRQVLLIDRAQSGEFVEHRRLLSKMRNSFEKGTDFLRDQWRKLIGLEHHYLVVLGEVGPLVLLGQDAFGPQILNQCVVVCIRLHLLGTLS